MFNIRFMPPTKSLDIFERQKDGVEENKITLDITKLDPFQYKNFFDMVLESMPVISIEYSLPDNTQDTNRIKSLLQVLLKDTKEKKK
jgi:hypothetical protein